WSREADYLDPAYNWKTRHGRLADLIRDEAASFGSCVCAEQAHIGASAYWSHNDSLQRYGFTA
ncbi:MAG TPA: hypothetical protein VHE81_12570, partial [Lacipirellulaceae bacterium]|nr:hypothetical protein [Lacipirellulaceae bacterium]